MNEPYWLTRLVVDALHVQMIAEHGGAYGVRDGSLIDSALARPRNKWAYGATEFAELGAAYAFGLVKNHGYMDGNRRVGFISTYVFLDMHGIEIVAPEIDVVTTFEDLAAGRLKEEDIAEWLRRNTLREGPASPLVTPP